ncbi:DUF1080 domain-containing protein [Planctomyces sp. SH-PL62]|uniref:3-keto-disaccharide hydrolase n=1 Tax=Planctomyces sp. SH-PL62 TaxID=1636152 RepID=UPI00078EB54D|nr:DUF1080 domain-containing protein [Planctomyces sp. SH-PL62]AMV39627.1 hypothetical protein VT85_19485 [Planctomyces sp. SH-PL62]
MRRLLGAIPTVLLLTGVMFGFNEPPQAIPLFDGKSLEGWVAEQTDGFAVHDGVLASKPGHGWLRSAELYKNFQLDLEFRMLKESSEGGVLFRASAETGTAEPHWPIKGYQAPITDGDGSLMLFGHGTTPPRFERKADALKAAVKGPGEWQKLTVKAIGPRVEISLDDVLITVADGVDFDAGHLGLYDKAGLYEWRNLMIRIHPD